MSPAKAIQDDATFQVPTTSPPQGEALLQFIGTPVVPVPTVALVVLLCPPVPVEPLVLPWVELVDELVLLCPSVPPELLVFVLLQPVPVKIRVAVAPSSRTLTTPRTSFRTLEPAPRLFSPNRKATCQDPSFASTAGVGISMDVTSRIPMESSTISYSKPITGAATTAGGEVSPPARSILSTEPPSQAKAADGRER